MLRKLRICRCFKTLHVMKFKCALCKQDNNRLMNPYYDWWKTKEWVISCSNCKTKLNVETSISKKEKSLLIFREIYMWSLFIWYLHALIFTESYTRQQYQIFLVVFVLSIIIHMAIPFLYKNREFDTTLVR